MSPQAYTCGTTYYVTSSLVRFLSLRNWQILESCIPDFHGALPILRASFLTGMWFWRPWRMGGSPTMLLLWPLARDELLGQNFCAIMFALQKSNIHDLFPGFTVHIQWLWLKGPIHSVWPQQWHRLAETEFAGWAIWWHRLEKRNSSPKAEVGLWSLCLELFRYV